MFRSQSIETDIKLKPMDSISITLSMCWSFQIATLPRPNTLLLPVSANVMWLLSDGRKVESMRRLRSPVIWLVHPLSIIHSEAFGVIPYSAVWGIGFTKRVVKHKHLTNKWNMEIQILVRIDRMSVKESRNEIHSKTICAFYLAPHKMFKVPSISIRSLWFPAGDPFLQKRVNFS